MKKIIYNITPFTTVDYKDHLSCIAWFVSCNMRCKYCYNPQIVDAKTGGYTIVDFLDFLKRRVGLLDAVVLSGGESTNYNLLNICTLIKKLGFKVKVDTNGTNPELISDLIDEELVDFVALDFKANESKFKEVTKTKFYNRFLNTLSTLINSNIEYEVRTTLHEDLLNENDINEMQKVLKTNGYNKTFYIQNFVETENLSNLVSSNKLFDKSLLTNDIDIQWR